MVFTRIGLGFVVGVTVPFLVNDMVYMTIANSFLRPHLKYRIERERLTEDKAVPTQLLDSYLKDVIGSFILFFVAIGPVVYTSYIKKSDLAPIAAPKKDEFGKVEEDRYTGILKQIKQREEPSEGEAKITFEEYEAFLRQLDKENKLDNLELQNPKSLVFHEMRKDLR